MNKKIVRAILEKEKEKYILNFNLEQTISLDLYNDNSEQIKILFVQILKEIINNDIEFLFVKGDSISESDRSLPYNVAKEYVDQLNNDLDKLKTNEYLIDIRKGC